MDGDWRQVAVTITAFLITVWTLLVDAHQRWVGTIEWAAALATVAPFTHPLASLADEMAELTCSRLRSEFGLKQKTAKRQLIAAALAC